MDRVIWDFTASAVARFVEANHPDRVPCKVRIDYKTRNVTVMAFVGREPTIACADFMSELESQGYVILGHGMSDTLLNWGVVVEPLSDETWVDCAAYEVSEV
jgi:hypothetical protein